MVVNICPLAKSSFEMTCKALSSNWLAIAKLLSRISNLAHEWKYLDRDVSNVLSVLVLSLHTICAPWR